jgi:transposase
MSKKPTKPDEETRRIYTAEFKENAVRMLLDGHSASSICQRLGISGTNLLYRWKKDFLEKGNGVASDLEQRVRELETELRRVERERDVLKKALSIFGRDG